MKNHLILCIAALSLLLLSACTSLNSPAGVGVVGTTLYHVGHPPAAITANAPLALQGHGRLWVTLYSQDSLLEQPSASMAYAIYSDGNSGPVTRHAHALFVQPTSALWSFQLESFKGPGVLGLSKEDIGGLTWTMQIMRVPSQGDWFSDVWIENGRSVPETWLVKRFSATPERSTRMVAEYREPWPECLDDAAADLMLVSGTCLKDFMRRADAAFTLDQNQPPQEQAVTAPSALKLPAAMPNTRKLVGEVWKNTWTLRP